MSGRIGLIYFATEFTGFIEKKLRVLPRHLRPWQVCGLCGEPTELAIPPGNILGEQVVL
jgi:hypothetical protein